VNDAERAGFELVGGRRIAYTRHEAQGDPRAIVVMAHGFKSSKIGPSRYFVPLARTLAARGVSTFRLDQPGSGDSDGDFGDSSFVTWTRTIEHFVRAFDDAGFRVGLLGQSMGGTAVMAATAALAGRLRGVALWSPGPMLDRSEQLDADAWVEEDGQRVRGAFWQEAEAIDFLRCLQQLDAPAYMVFGTADHLISEAAMRRVAASAKPDDRVRVIDGLPHSAWPFERWTEIIAETADFLVRSLAVGDPPP
jgi:pimeloyl-ACP methyl ester carboxylesterase